jgi:hypothetical protein
MSRLYESVLAGIFCNYSIEKSPFYEKSKFQFYEILAEADA